VNSSSGSTLQCDTWLWDDMRKRPPCWNSTPGFDFDHITTVDMSLHTMRRCHGKRNSLAFYPNWTTFGTKK